MSPAFGLAWLIWTRHRLGLSLFAAALLLVVLLRALFPDLSPVWHLVPAFNLVAWAVVYFPAVFSFRIDTRLERTESGFPPRLLCLPMPTWALVGWPMLWGSASVAGTWLILAAGVVRPMGFPVPLVWPGLNLAFVLTLLQTLIWMPLPLPWLRLLFLIPALCAVSILPVSLHESGVSDTALGGTLFLLLALTYGAATFAVSRARRGGVLRREWPWWSRTKVGLVSFRSPLQSQRWFEWRRCGLSLPLMVASLTLVWLASLTTIAGFVEDAAQAGLFLFPQPLLRELGSLWLTSGCLILWPLFFSSICGPEWGKLPGRERTENVSPFLATRPVSTGLLVRAKCEAAAQSALVGWAIIVVGFLLWFALGGKAGEMIEQLIALRLRHSAALFWAALVLFFATMIGMTWLNAVEGFWFGLTTRAWRTAMSTVLIVGFFALFAMGRWLADSPERWQRFLDLFPWLAVGVVGAKLWSGFFTLRALQRRQLFSHRILPAALAAWIVLAAGIVGFLSWLIPSSYVSLSGLVIGTTCLLPLTRLALAPLALDWKRHL